MKRSVKLRWNSTSWNTRLKRSQLSESAGRSERQVDSRDVWTNPWGLPFGHVVRILHALEMTEAFRYEATNGKDHEICYEHCSGSGDTTLTAAESQYRITTR